MPGLLRHDPDAKDLYQVQETCKKIPFLFAFVHFDPEKVHFKAKIGLLYKSTF